MVPIATGERLRNRYSLAERVGSGGMGDVWRAHDDVLDRPVAIKILRGAGESDLQRFHHEMRTQAALDHPSIVPVLDAGDDAESPYFVLRYVEGRSLHAELAEGPLATDRVRAIGVQIAQALDHAHSAGVVHRDVTPGNILLCDDGRAVLTDFGIAHLVDRTRITAHGQAVGSPGYIAPEQIEGRTVGGAADVYSLGLVLLEALTGRREFTGTPVEAAMARLTRSPAVPDTLPEDLAPLLRAMCAREPGDRPSPAQVAERLDRHDAPSVGTWAAAAGPATAVAAEATSPLPSVDAATSVIDPVEPNGGHTTVMERPPVPTSTAPAGWQATSRVRRATDDRRRPLWLAVALIGVVLALGVASAGDADLEVSPPPTTVAPPTTAVPPTTAPPPPPTAPPPPPVDADEENDREDDDDDDEGRGNDGDGNGRGRGNGRGNDDD